MGKGIGEIARNALDALQQYHWPGNVRELRNEVERAHIRTRDGHVIRLGDLSPETLAARLVSGDQDGNVDPKSLEDLQKLIDALRATGGNVTRAAKMLDVHRNTVHRWMRKYDLEAM